MIERGKMRKQLIDDDMNDMTENFLPIYFTRSGSIENKCEKARYQYPCRPKQVNHIPHPILVYNACCPVITTAIHICCICLFRLRLSICVSVDMRSLLLVYLLYVCCICLLSLLVISIGLSVYLCQSVYCCFTSAIHLVYLSFAWLHW